MALSLVEAVRSRYGSLRISDDLFGDSDEDSSENVFYSTSPDSGSSAAGSLSEDERRRRGFHTLEQDKARNPECKDEIGEDSRFALNDLDMRRRILNGNNRGRRNGEESSAAAEKARDGIRDESKIEDHCEGRLRDDPNGLRDNIEDENVWSDTLKDISSPIFNEITGPIHEMPSTSSVMDFFQLFITDNIIKNIVTQTNMYAKKYQERFGSDDSWMDVTLAEIKTFLGYMISASTHHYESVLSIWSCGFSSNKSIALIMTQSRFEKILKYFHVVAFRSSQTAHGLYKIQPLLDSLQTSFDSSFRPSQTQVLHEPLIDEDTVFITTCTERELRKRKKRKFSLWVRQCSATGFICQVYIHLKEGSAIHSLDTLKNKPQLHSIVAKNLCQNTSGKNYIIFTGPSITSLNLFEEFKKQGIYCCGLLSCHKSDCSGLPKSFLNNKEIPQSRGQYGIKMKGNMSLISWYNKGHFHFLTNAYSPVQQGVIIKKREEIPCPLAVEAFAAHLSYICKYDDKYSKYFISHKQNKTWQQVFWLAISIAINNAYILYKMSDAYHVKKYSRAQFGDRLVSELLGLEEYTPCQ
ncbi:piggyBac transposable element-derived protein 5 [Rhinophrynus dorsalis]